jgi:hypothetical protein
MFYTHGNRQVHSSMNKLTRTKPCISDQHETKRIWFEALQCDRAEMICIVFTSVKPYFYQNCWLLSIIENSSVAFSLIACIEENIVLF